MICRLKKDNSDTFRQLSDSLWTVDGQFIDNVGTDRDSRRRLKKTKL